MTSPNTARPPAPAPERSEAALQLAVAEFEPTADNLLTFRDSDESVYGVITGAGSDRSAELAAQITHESLVNDFNTLTPLTFQREGTNHYGQKIDKLTVQDIAPDNATKALRAVYKSATEQITNEASVAGASDPERTMGAKLSMVKMFEDEYGNVRAAYGHVGDGILFIERRVKVKYGVEPDTFYRTESQLEMLSATESENKMTAEHEPGLHRFGVTGILKPGDRVVVAAAGLVDKTLTEEKQNERYAKALNHADPNDAAKALAKLNPGVNSKAILVIDVAGSGNRRQKNNQPPTPQEDPRIERQNQELKRFKRQQSFARMAGKLGLKDHVINPMNAAHEEAIRAYPHGDPQYDELILNPDRVENYDDALDEAYDEKDRRDLTDKTERQKQEQQNIIRKQKRARYAAKVGMSKFVKDPIRQMMNDPEVVQHLAMDHARLAQDRLREEADFPDRITDVEEAREAAEAEAPAQEARLAQKAQAQTKAANRPARPTRRRPTGRP